LTKEVCLVVFVENENEVWGTGGGGGKIQDFSPVWECSWFHYPIATEKIGVKDVYL